MSMKLEPSRKARLVGMSFKDMRNISRPLRNRKVLEDTQEVNKLRVRGYLTVCYGIDTVILNHKVNGRVSEMYLTSKDTIYVDRNGKTESVTTEEVLNRENATFGDANKGKSLYQNVQATVALDPQGSKQINSLQKRWRMREITILLRDELITETEAVNSLMQIDLEENENE